MRSRIKRITVLVGLVGLLAAVPWAGTDDLRRGFMNPPDEAKPWTFWWWLEGNVTKAGITKDLEEMKRQGINGVLIFNAGGPAGEMPQGVRFLSPGWHDLFKFALREAARLRIDVSMNLCDGWDSGGAWITPDEANKTLVHSETQVDGPGGVLRTLPLPPVVDGYYHDVATVAFREPPGRPLTPAAVTASSTPGGYCDEWNQPPGDAADGDPETFWSSRPSLPAWIAFDYEEPIEAAGVFVVPGPDSGPKECEIQESVDGKTFATVARLTMDKGKAKRADFEPVRARRFRLVITSAYGPAVQIAEMVVLRKGDVAGLRPGIRWWVFKSGNRSFWDWPRRGPEVLNEEYAETDDARDCRATEIVDLTARLDARGRLAWEVPGGRWTILRFGYTLEGQRTRCACAGGPTGYEADMLGSKGIESQFRNVAEPILADAAAVAGNTLKYFHIDSYELGADIRGQQPTWSDGFLEEFKSRRGYELGPYLPALARRIVDSRELTDRFLWDFRRTIADLFAERFWRRYVELAHQHGVGAHMETGYGTYPYPHIDGLECAGSSDIPMGEFWYGTDIMSQFNPWGNVIRSVASAAHIYGRRLVQAESFTAWSHWMESPGLLKPVGDEAFLNGLNRMVFHQYTHQPAPDMKPGWQYGAGTHFDRNITWWEQARDFFRYLARCQFLLQKGMFVADACYFYGEGATAFIPSREFVRPPLPPGTDFDGVNSEVLLRDMTVRDGRLVLPGGMDYRVLVLPEATVLSPGVVLKLTELVRAGATVLGPKPLRAPGLRNHPRSDEETRKLADGLWGTDPKVGSGERKLGYGRIVWGKPLGEVLASSGLGPDFTFKGRARLTAGEKEEKEAPVLDFIHRRDGDSDAYFVVNRRDRREARLDCAFRVSGKQPEIWDPVTGEAREATSFTQAGGLTSVPLEFPSHGSLFVVFRRPIAAGAGGITSSNFRPLTPLMDIRGPWRVTFDPAWGGPGPVQFDELLSWTERPEEGIKYYSGRATYRKTFDLPAAVAAKGRRLFLDLGTVKYVAEVRLNGKAQGVVWTAPWRADVSDARPGANTLEIDVVNLWPNRVIGDALLPPGRRLTKTNVRFDKGMPLLESGLLGPVRLLAEGDGSGGK